MGRLECALGALCIDTGLGGICRSACDPSGAACPGGVACVALDANRVEDEPGDEERIYGGGLVSRGAREQIIVGHVIPGSIQRAVECERSWLHPLR